MSEQLSETIEDLQFRALRRTKIFDPLALGNCKEFKKWIAASSRYGICVFVGTQNKIYSCFCAHIHKLETHSTGDSDVSDISFRTLDYHNQNAHIRSIAVNCDGSVIAFAINTSNGPFIEIFDVVTFAPTDFQKKTLCPVASIRLSSKNNSHFVDLQWNPVEPETFVALASDNTLSTFKYSLQMGSSFSLLGSLSVRATCLCWSPKGKQLAIGDASGKVHQLKPDLSSVRVIDPPPQIPIFGSSANFACLALCWLSTTEWLVSHTLDNSAELAPNIALLVVKKQQPPKWTHFGDVLSLSRRSLTFCPMLEWHMVFALSAESPSVVVFGLRGDKWLKFEFETFDMEMPLTADSKDTFPLGITLDFSSTESFPIGDGSDKSLRSAPPFVHFLNSSGLLLPYAVLSLSERPLVTKAPEHIEMKNTKFGKSPAKDGEEQLAQKTPTDHRQQNDQPKANAILTTTNHQKDSHLVEEKVLENADNESRKKEKLELKLKNERDKIAALERALEKSVTEYTAKRNDQTERIAQLSHLRREVEKSASSLDTGLFVELFSIRTELQQSFRQSLSSLDRAYEDTNDKIEFLNGLKLSYSVLREGKASAELNKPSFDMKKRLHLIEEKYENIMDKMKKVRKAIDKFEGHRKQQIPRTAENATIGPIEQRKIIQINENIAKMSAKLSSRLHQIRRRVGSKFGPLATASGAKKMAQFTIPSADFCALELEQLKLPSVENDRPQIFTCETASDFQQLKKNLRDYLLTRPNEIEVKCIGSIKTPDESKTLQKTPTQSVAVQKLAQRISEATSSPPKPQLVSVGVQSPDFEAENREKALKKAPSKKTSTPKTTKNGGQKSLRNAMPTPPTPLTFSIPPAKQTETTSNEAPITTKPMEKIPDKVTMPLVAPSTEKAMPSPAETPAISQIQAKEKELTREEGQKKPIEKDAQPAEEPQKANVAEEGMDDEVTTDTTRDAVTFSFMNSGLGSSTPIDPSRNPFGSMVSPPQGSSSSTSGRSLFATAPNSFGTPSIGTPFGTPSPKPTFGSMGVAPSASASPFGASPFSSQSAFGVGASASSAFGGGASFGSVSPFSSAKPGGFGASPFGGGMTSGGKSMFGGGIGTAGTAPAALSSGFSAFANKSAGFGQLAGQQHQQQSPPSLFGGGPSSTDTSFNQPKTSAFTTFRK